ncbi:MAG: nucleoside hydrolase [bacterium]|nr:nucleoside hydrolase [Candidatus Colisoma equi]
MKSIEEAVKYALLCGAPCLVLAGFAPMAVAMDADAVLRLGRANEVPRVIFDTDMVEDYDDVGALAALHALADENRCEILATVSCTRGNQSVATVEVINAFYGRKDIPVGCAKEMGVEGTTKGRADMSGHQKYVRIAKDYSRYVRHANSDDAPDANVIYRKVLSAAPDKGVTVCSVGFLTNLRRLLETKPDSISPLSGGELVTKKVKALYAMAGKYPQGREYNVEWDVPSARVVFDRWPTPIFISDFNLGRSIYSGRKVSETAYGYPNPVKDVYARSLPSRAATHESRCWDKEEGGHSSWDPVTVLASVLGSTPYFTVRHGYFTIDESGANTWHDDPAKAGGVLECATSCGHSRQSMGTLLDDLIARQPKSAWAN